MNTLIKNLFAYLVHQKRLKRLRRRLWKFLTRMMIEMEVLVGEGGEVEVGVVVVIEVVEAHLEEWGVVLEGEVEEVEVGVVEQAGHLVVDQKVEKRQNM